MTPKEKAKYLYDLMGLNIEGYNVEWEVSSKDCAIACVNEILLSFEELSLNLNEVHQALTTPVGISKFTNDFRKYWTEVLKELHDL